MSSIGFYIVISLIFLQIILTFIFYTRSLNPIKKYTLDITDKYIFYLTGLQMKLKLMNLLRKKEKVLKSKVIVNINLKLMQLASTRKNILLIK